MGAGNSCASFRSCVLFGVFSCSLLWLDGICRSSSAAASHAYAMVVPKSLNASVKTMFMGHVRTASDHS